MNYQLSLLAERDLANIAQSTHERWGDNQARQYVQLLEGALQQLVSHPLKIAALPRWLLVGGRRASSEALAFYGLARHQRMGIMAQRTAVYIESHCREKSPHHARRMDITRKLTDGTAAS